MMKTRADVAADEKTLVTLFLILLELFLRCKHLMAFLSDSTFEY
jgi:hypothetical protein